MSKNSAWNTFRKNLEQTDIKTISRIHLKIQVYYSITYWDCSFFLGICTMIVVPSSIDSTGWTGNDVNITPVGLRLF
jgi:hypothetical protein